MKYLQVFLAVPLFLTMISCGDDPIDDTEEVPAIGFIQYSINGDTFRFENRGTDCSSASYYQGGNLEGVGLTGGINGTNSINISDYISIMEGNLDITVDIVEDERFLFSLNYNGTQYAIFWGSGFGVTTGSGSINYTTFEPDANNKNTQLVGSFSFVVYNLLNQAELVDGTFSFE